MYMTPKRFFNLLDEYQIMSGQKKKESDFAIENLP